VELDLAAYTYDFPRDLEVAVGRSGEPAAVVWTGDTAGLAALGILNDPRAATVAIPLTEAAVGDRLILTLRSAYGSQQWSVAELRVFARAAP
jgi:hypothetical protein